MGRPSASSASAGATRVGQPHGTPALLLDLYELTMGESYVREGLAERPATFQLFCRKLPEGWGYLVAAGLADALAYLEGLRFDAHDLSYLSSTGLFGERFVERLRGLRFTGDVKAMPEGTVFFPGEPVLEITAPLVEAQLVETVVLNQIHFQSLLASKAARCVDAVRGRRLVDFALRRTHGGEAGLKAARASYVAGFDATSNVLAGQLYGIPVAGTMAHSFVECFANEATAFTAFTRAYPQGSTLLIDTYDTLEGARLAAATARAVASRGGHVSAVRLDSGDLRQLSVVVRRVLDDEGLPDVGIFASGGLDELDLESLLAAGAPIDGFGVGSKLGVSADAPYLDMAYKLAVFDGRPVLKLSTGKATLPGRKQVWRLHDRGRFAGDLVALADEERPPGSEPLLRSVMARGERRWHEPVDSIRARAAAQREQLPAAVRRTVGGPYPVELSEGLKAVTETLTRRLATVPALDAGAA